MGKRPTLEDVYPARDDELEMRCARDADEFELEQPVVWVPAAFADEDSNMVEPEHLWCAIENGELDLNYPSIAGLLRQAVDHLREDREETLTFGEPTKAERRLVVAALSAANWLDSRGSAITDRMDTPEFFCPDCVYDPEKRGGHASDCPRIRTCGQFGPPWVEDLHPEAEWMREGDSVTAARDRHIKDVEHTKLRVQ